MSSYFYLSKPGDWLSKITLKYLGSASPATWQRVYEFNKEAIGADPNKLAPETLIWFPPGMNAQLQNTGDLIIMDSEDAPRQVIEEKALIIGKKQKGMIPKVFTEAGLNNILIFGGIGLVAFALLSDKK